MTARQKPDKGNPGAAAQAAKRYALKKAGPPRRALAALRIAFRRKTCYA